MRWAIYFGYTVTFCAVIGVAYGVHQIYAQNNLITTARPVKALVTETSVRKVRQQHFIRWAPDVSYEYTVDAKKYTSDTVTPTECVGSKEWATQIIARYPVGKIVTAHVDSLHPDSSFLLPKYGPMPYLAVLVCAVIAAMGLAAVVEQAWNSTAPSAAQSGIGGVKLVPLRRPKIIPQTRGIAALAGIIIGTPTLLHYWMVSEPPRDPLFLLLTAAFGIAVAIQLALATIGYWRCGPFGDPRLTISCANPSPGQKIHFDVAIPIGFSGTLRSVAMQILCESKDKALFDISGQDRDKILLRHDNDLVRARSVNNGDEVDAKADFHIPPLLPPSTPPDSKERMHVVWTIKLKVIANLFRQAETTYILNIKP